MACRGLSSDLGNGPFHNVSSYSTQQQSQRNRIHSEAARLGDIRYYRNARDVASAKLKIWCLTCVSHLSAMEHFNWSCYHGAASGQHCNIMLVSKGTNVQLLAQSRD